ncbi:3-hydroxydecanoyl-[ACP] dehydratase [uncultured Candidatus Thioglobus sp.]|nr:3-hydroxydecanoyl-[ACP] dehydratase [uncultured Candidatus Thioglobus sp.]
MFNNAELCDLIPHAGKMCLIDSIKKWDEDTIICTTKTHQNSDNPLLSNGILPVSALIEYGAQAMAIHGALLTKKSDKIMQKGYLAALKNVKFENIDISNMSVLTIKATKKMSMNGNMIYDFSVFLRNDRLIAGRATVIAVFD